MNNYWHTNYKADQEGPVTLRYVVTPHHGSDLATAKKLGLEAASPLIPVAVDPASPVPRFPLRVDDRSLGRDPPQAHRGRKGLDPAALQRSPKTPRPLLVAGDALDQGRVFLSDLSESRGPRLLGRLSRCPPSAS